MTRSFDALISALAEPLCHARYFGANRGGEHHAYSPCQWCRDEVERTLALVQPVPDSAGEAITDVVAERERQRSVLGWTPAHDDTHTDGYLALAACAYASAAIAVPLHIWNANPDRLEIWKSHRTDRTPREKLVRAAALIVAEIERLDRASASAPQPEDEG